MPLSLVTEPASEPVSVAEAKAWANIEISDDDVLVGLMIKQAREMAEHECNRAFMPQTWDLVMDAFPDGGIKVPLPPLQSITSVQYVDTAGATQTLAADQYDVDIESAPGWITPAYGLSWPQTRAVVNAVRVRFICGYTNETAVPESVKSWIKVAVASFYMNREKFGVGGISWDFGQFIDGLLDRYRVYD